MKNFIKLFSILVLFFFTVTQSQSAEKVDYLKTDWSFKGLFGKFDRGSLQRGYQVYTEVCASCHSMKYLSLGISLSDRTRILLCKLDNPFEVNLYQIYQKVP